MLTRFLGLTGGIGSGKSEALSALKRLGAETLSTDAVTHELLGSGELRGILVERWGKEIAPAGEIDRQKVAAIVFENPDELKWLESQLHPRVGRRVGEWREGLDPSTAVAVVEVPLLFETGMDEFFDGTIAVIADDEVRQARLAERDWADIEEREQRQLDQGEKAARADYVIRNDESVENLERRLGELLEQLGEAVK